MVWLFMPVVFLIFLSGTAVASPREEAAHCIARLTAIHAEVAEAERVARQTNDLSRADCIQKQLVSLTGLLEVGRTVQSWLEASAEVDDGEAVADELEKLQVICLRAEKLQQQANACASTESRRPKKTSPPLSVKTERPAPPSRSAWQAPRRATARNPAECLRQSDLACLLAQALNLGGGGDCLTVLTEREVTPLGGWDGGQCSTVEDFCVAVARALALEVRDTEDPAAYREALADFGLPVESALPPSSGSGKPVMLLDREAREFLSQGLAAPVR